MQTPVLELQAHRPVLQIWQEAPLAQRCLARSAWQASPVQPTAGITLVALPCTEWQVVHRKHRYAQQDTMACTYLIGSYDPWGGAWCAMPTVPQIRPCSFARAASEALCGSRSVSCRMGSYSPKVLLLAGALDRV